MTRDFRIEITALGTVGLRALSVQDDADATMLHDWFNRDYARPWGMAGKTLSEVREKYASLLAEPGYEVLVGYLASTGEALFLLECYDPARDLLGAYYQVAPGDRGFHMINAPLQRRVPGLTWGILQTINAYVFRDPAVQRIVGEPDIRNAKVLARCVQAGYRLGKVVHLPHKTARMILITRGRYRQFDYAAPPAELRSPMTDISVRLHMLAGRIGRKIGLIRSDY